MRNSFLFFFLVAAVTKIVERRYNGCKRFDDLSAQKCALILVALKTLEKGRRESTRISEYDSIQRENLFLFRVDIHLLTLRPTKWFSFFYTLLFLLLKTVTLVYHRTKKKEKDKMRLTWL